MESTYQSPEQNENLLDGEYVALYQASHGKRFLNYLVDEVIIYIVWRVLIFNLVIKLLTAVYVYTESKAALYTLTFLIVYAISFFFLAGLESLTGGKTIGKMMTRTRAVNQDGTRISPKTAFLRSLSRCVPFEAFSALGAPCFPWHDKWTNTFVIDENTSTLPS